MSVDSSATAQSSLRIPCSPWRCYPRFMGAAAPISSAGEGSPGEEQVLPGAGLVGERAQEVGRMVGDDHRNVAIAVHAAAQAREAGVRAEQALRRDLAER